MAELIVLSHLRWPFVWQRPQHLVSRLARSRPTWFVEEPEAAAVSRPRLRQEQHGPVRRVWLQVPGDDVHHDFDSEAAAGYGELLQHLLGDSDERTVWLYTPLALGLAEALQPCTLVYDVMDDLASFQQASPALELRQIDALRRADVVFTGGRSLHRMATGHRAADVHLFPSGVEAEHYAAARRRSPRTRPVAGYVGVIDERLDLSLIANLVSQLPDWEIQMVGPVAKIDPSSLPTGPNLVYSGSQPYERLPSIMAGFDVALMPFALNQATRSISPTKTLEYLAAGLPVVSTRVPDVVADFAGVVDLRDDAAGFAEACRRAGGGHPEREHRVKALLRWHDWDAIAERMEALALAAPAVPVRREAEG